MLKSLFTGEQANKQDSLTSSLENTHRELFQNVEASHHISWFTSLFLFSLSDRSANSEWLKDIFTEPLIFFCSLQSKCRSVEILAAKRSVCWSAHRGMWIYSGTWPSVVFCHCSLAAEVQMWKWVGDENIQDEKKTIKDKRFLYYSYIKKELAQVPQGGTLVSQDAGTGFQVQDLPGLQSGSKPDLFFF